MGEQQHSDRHSREKILATATRLFSEQGYDNTSLAQVAREAQVSKALIFWHFDSKEKLFRAALGRTLEPYTIRSGELEGLDECAQIERLIDQFYNFVRDNVYSVRFLLGLILRGEKQSSDVTQRVSELYGVFRRQLAQVIEKGCRSGRFRADAHPPLDAALILAALDGILIEHFMSHDFLLDPQELLTHLKRTVTTRLLGSNELQPPLAKRA
jgi:TetR/AcrR family transcriptional regulator